VTDIRTRPEAAERRPGAGQGELFPEQGDATPAVRRIAGIDVEWWVLAAMVVTWILVFGRLVLLRQSKFGSVAWDMGIFDQATWLISHHHGLFITVRGLHFFGHHANIGLFLLAPFYWLGAGANFLNLVMVTSMALGAVPIFLLARDRLRNPWLGLPLVAAYLLHPALQFMAWELFHPEVMAITPLFFAWWFARRERWRWFAACLIYAVCWKEDVALAAVVMGLVLMGRKQWRVGLLTSGLALVWFALVNDWMLPTFSGAGQAFYNSWFGPLGDSFPQILFNSLRHPTLITRRVFAGDAISYYWQMAVPFAFIPLAAPTALALGIPQVLVDVLSVNNFTRTITYHYAALPLVGLTLGAVEGVKRLENRPSQARFLVGLIAATALAASVAWGPSPIGSQYAKGRWPLAPDARVAAKEAAVRVPPADGHVSATYTLTPHLAHRRYIYDYPNPWISDNWALNGENLPNPNIVQWLVLDRQLLGGRNLALLNKLVSDGEFRVVWERDGIVVAHRMRPGTRVDLKSLGS